ncbi:MAG: ABC transporter ATP-binding protein [Candidatus Hodarchaeales archaeon]
MVFFEVKNLYFKYEENWILNDISLNANKGEFIALVGPSGCGKTTFLKILVGILTPQMGSILIDQTIINDWPIEKRNVGYMPQQQALFPHLKVYENISFGLSAQKWKKDKIKNRVNELVQMGGVENLLKRRPHELSGGQQQRVALLRALAPSPQLLLLDEPLSNIDTQLREQLAIYIRMMQQLLSITTLFVTHDLNEAKMLADRIIVLNKGIILQEGSPRDISLNPNSIDVAISLGLKNLFKVYSITQNTEFPIISLTTEIGKIDIPENLSKNVNNKTVGVYIDPFQLKVSKHKVIEPNTFFGEILAIIPDPNVHHSMLLIKIHYQENGQKNHKATTNNSKNMILRVQLPISNTEFKKSDQIYVTILPTDLKFFN